MSSEPTLQSLAEPGITPTSEVPDVSYSVSSLVPVSVLRPMLDTQWTLGPLGVILGGDYREAKEGTKQDLLLSRERESLGKCGLGYLTPIVLLLCVLPPLSSQ